MASGIDAISIYIPKLYLDIKGQWSDEKSKIFADGDKDKLVSKIEKGLGISKIAQADGHEDPATMAAMAIKDLLEKHSISLSDVGHLSFATETGLDHSKPVSTYVLGMLEDHFEEDTSHIGTIEQKFACIGSTYALESTLALLDSGRLSKKYALVVCSDIAKYDLDTPAEYTQGAGAVALLLSREPKLVEFDQAPMGTYTLNERDFFRPLWSQTPTVDGKYSMNVYNKCVEGAFDDLYNHLNVEDSKEFLENIDHLLFHLPFPKMANYATAQVLYPAVFPEKEQAEYDDLKNYMKTEEFSNYFKEKVQKSLGHSSSVGNLYTGSLYLGLASLLSNALANNNDLSDHSCIFCAYGSGASAKVFRGTITKSWKESAQKIDLDFLVSDERRTAVNFEDYNRLHKEKNTLNREEIVAQSVVAPKEEFGLRTVGNERSKDRVDVGLRYYQFYS